MRRASEIGASPGRRHLTSRNVVATQALCALSQERKANPTPRLLEVPPDPVEIAEALTSIDTSYRNVLTERIAGDRIFVRQKFGV